MANEKPLYTLYNALKEQNFDVPDKYDSFERTLTEAGNGGADSRHKLYNALKEQNFDVPDNYASFYSTLFTPVSRNTSRAIGGQEPSAQQAQQKQAATATTGRQPAGKAQKPQGGTPMTEADKAAAMYATDNIVGSARAATSRTKRRMDYARANTGLDVPHTTLGNNDSGIRLGQNRHVTATPTYNAETGETEHNYTTESGNVFDNRAEADLEQNSVDDARYQLEHREDWLRQQKAAVEAELNKRAAEIDEDAPVFPTMVPTGGDPTGAPLQEHARTETYRKTDKKYGMLQAQLNQIDDALATIEEAKKGKTSNKWIADSSGWVERNGKELAGFFGGAWRGLVHAVGKASTWDMGVTDMGNNAAVLSAVRKANENGIDNISQDERDLLNLTAINNEVQAENAEYIGHGYKAGEVTGESLPFMIEMMMNPASGLGKSAANKLMQVAVKKYGKEAVKKAARKYMAAKIGTRLLGDVAGSALMAGTTGLGHVTADTLNRLTGDVKFKQDDTGHIVYDGTEGAESSAAKAFLKAFGAQTIENHSEMVGEYFAPFLGWAGKKVSKGLTKMGLDDVNRFIEGVGATDFAKMIGSFEKHAKWNGTIGEYAEEVVGNIENALLVGDNTLDTAKGTGVFNKEQNWDTFLGVSLMGGFISGAKTLSYRGPKRQAMNEMSAAGTAIDRALGDNMYWREKWGGWRNTFLVGTDEEMKTTLREIMDDTSLPINFRRGVADFVKAAQKYKGLCMAQESKAQDGGHDPVAAAYDESYDNGYETTDPAARNAAKTALDEKRAALAGQLGIGEDEVDDHVGDPLHYIDEQRKKGVGAEDMQAVIDYANAKSAYDGMIDAVRDDIDTQIEQSDAAVAARVNNADGLIHPATMRGTGTDATDRQVYVVSGSVVMRDDGTGVDLSRTDGPLVVRDAETGAMEMIAPDDVRLTIDGQTLDPEEEKRAAADAIREETARRAAAEIDGETTLLADPDARRAAEAGGTAQARPTYGVNDTFTMTDAGGNTVRGTVHGVNEDGVEIETDTPLNGRRVQVVPVDEFEGMVDSISDADGNPTWTREAQQEQPTLEEGQPTDDHFADGNNMVGDDAAAAPPATETPTTEQATPDTADNEGTATAAPTEGTAIDNDAAPATDAASTAVPAAPTESASAGHEPTALERVPKDENGEPIYEQADPETAWGAIVEQTYGNERLAQAVVNSMVGDKEAALKKAEKAKARQGRTIAEKIAAEQERQQAIDNAKAELKHWQSIAMTQQRRRADAERVKADEARKAAEARAEEEAKAKAEREEAERKEREAINGVPDWVDDTPQNARARGFRRSGGGKFDRQQPLVDSEYKPTEVAEGQAAPIYVGKEVDVKFTDKVKQKGRVAVVEASSIQPSHYHGQPNVLHFIPEAQPKKRTDDASVTSAEDIAANINPEEITSSVTAYTGAPSLNARGETIQGNNRSAALKQMWESHPEQAAKYKQWLIDHAEEYGLKSEDIARMQQPVLANIMDVDDARAIELGQYDVKDTESGGTERIKAKNVVTKMGKDMKTFAGRLLSSADDEASFSQLVDKNGLGVLKWMAQKGYITPTQYKSALDSKGNITAEAANDLKNIMYQSIFQGGHERLEEAFGTLPAKAQRAILATMYRDYDSPETERMVPEVQSSIMAYNELMQDEGFAGAKNMKEAQTAVLAWQRQYQFDDATGESRLNSDKYSNFALQLAAMYRVQTQSLIQGTFNQMFDLIQGTQEATLFNQDTLDNTPRTLVEAIKEALNIDYNGQQRSNVLAGDSEAGQQRRQGSRGDAEADGRGKSGNEPAGREGGTEGNSGRGEDTRGNRGLQEPSNEGIQEVYVGLSDKETDDLLSQMEANAVEMPQLELNPKNWVSQFGEGGTVSTPVGQVKMGANQIAKLFEKGRSEQFGMIKPTLENPHVVIEVPSESNDGNTERSSSLLFIKTFTGKDGKKIYYFKSVTVKKDGLEVSVSSHYDRVKRVKEALKKGKLLYRFDGGAQTEHHPADVSVTTSHENGQGFSSADKVTNNQRELQTNNEKSAGSEQVKLSSKVEAASQEVNTHPSEAQKEAGNYKKGHVQVGTFDISIEQPEGSIRRGKDADGKQWESKMHNTYGYIRGTEGVDGDHIDVFLSTDIDGWNGRKVFVVDQYNPDGTFDEHKVMLGFNDMDEAKSDYLANYEKGWENGRRITVTAVSLEDFEKWIDSSHRKTKPFSEYSSVKRETVTNAPAKEEAEKSYRAALDHESDVEQEWEEKIQDYVAEHYPTQAVLSAESKSEQGLREKEAMRKDAVLKKMREEAKEATDEARKASAAALARLEEEEAGRKPRLQKADTDEIEATAKEHGVDATWLSRYAEGMRERNSAAAVMAMRDMKALYLREHTAEKKALMEREGISGLRANKRLFEPIEKAIKAKYGDVDVLVEERRKQAEQEHNIMEAARKRAEEEERKRDARLEELAGLTDEDIDKRYAEALEKGDEAAAREMLDEAARRKGYGDATSDYQGVGAWSAPSDPGFATAEERRADVEENGGDVNLDDISHGYSPVQEEMYSHPERTGFGDEAGIEAGRAINNALNALKEGNKNVKIKVYRAVPTSVKESKLRNGDWVTPSRKYAEMHGNSRLEGKYRIIEDEVPASELWFDGNDIREWGYDNGKSYRYKNAKNNRKLNDLVTRDDNGNIIPPSKRFNSRKADERYQKADSKAQADKRETALRNAVVDRLREGGMDVSMDTEEGQRVLDEVNGKGETVRQQARLNALAKAATSIRNWLVGNKRGKTFTIELPLSTQRMIHKVMGRDFDSHNITANGIAHAKRNHGENGLKLNEKSIALRDEDFELMPYIMTAPDYVRKGTSDVTGRESIRFYKELGNGYVVVAEKEYKNSPDDMETITMWAEKSSSEATNARRNAPDTHVRNAILSTEDAAKIRKDAEMAIQNDKNIREQRVYHGSGADFDRFDHSHMGEGEGAQAYGWGTYVTEVEGIGRTYAEQNSKKFDNPVVRKMVARMQDMMAEGKTFEEAKSEALERMRAAYEKGKGRDGYESFTADYEKLKGMTESEFQNRHLYTVEIPDDTVENYLDWDKPLTRGQLETIREGLVHLMANPAIPDNLKEKLREWNNGHEPVIYIPDGNTGKQVYEAIAEDIFADYASAFLSSLGFTGIKYPADFRRGGREDGKKNYVIFNENDAKITDHVRFFRTADGEAYGFTIGGKIYIDPRIANSETPIHEYAHLWATALRNGNAEEWKNVVGLMKGTKVWDEVRKRYPELESDDDIADEVLATYSGRRGAERLRGEMDAITSGNGSVMEKAEAVNALERVKQAIRKFWKATADMLHIHFTSAEEVADRVMKDLLDGMVPGKAETRSNERERLQKDDDADGDMYRTADNEELEEVNERFNEQVDGFTQENADKTIFDLGRPSGKLLASGVEDKPIRLYGSKVVKKMKKHGFTVDELRDLPKAVANPIAVFANQKREGNHSVLTELHTANGNFLVTIDLGKGTDADFDIVSSVFGKRGYGVATWINKGYMKYVDKEKALNYLHLSAPIAEASEKSELLSAANVVRNFENPKLSGENVLREGDGAYTDEELSWENDPVGKMLGRNRWSKRRQGEFAARERERMAARVQELAERLHLNNVEVVTDASTLEGKRKRAKGFYNKRSGRITIVIPNHASMADVEQTLLHEAVGHYGLRELFGERFDTFLGEVYDHADGDVRAAINALMSHNGWDVDKATEEYLAGLAEDTDFEGADKGPGFYGWWSFVKRAFLDMLHKIGFGEYYGPKLSDNELRYILWRSYENLKEPGRYRSILGEAEDVSKQMELKVGEFAEREEMPMEKASEEDMFRDGDNVDYEKAQARNLYEERVSRGMYQMQEAMQDSMLGLKEAMDAVLKAEGQTLHIEDVAGYENAYLGENRLSSVNQAECEAFERTLFKPLLDKVAALAKTADERAELTDYMMAKHGLERNEVMARREAKKTAEKKFGAELRKAEQELAKAPNDQTAIDALDDVKRRMDDYEQKQYDKNRERDYAGLTALTGMDDVTDAEQEARQMVADYENGHDKWDVMDLWDRVHDVTGATLSKTYESGLISKATYDDIRGMYKWYIPLRGFDEKTSDEVYGYLNSGRSAFNSPIKAAKGRKSKADDPFANMESMAESAIMQGNRNVLVKQKFLNFALNHPSDLVSVSDLWLRYDDAADEWKPINTGDVAGTERLEETDSPTEVERKMSDFNAAMEQLAAQEPDRYVRQRERPDVPYRVVGSENLHEHQVVVKRGGKDYLLTINGNPRAAQALNGRTNPDVNANGAWGTVLETVGDVNRTLSMMYTTLQPDFVASNFLRDTLYANSMVWVKESPEYAARYNANYVKTKRVMSLLGKLRKGTLDMGDETERQFKQFMENGGETGYMRMADIDAHKKEIQAFMDKMNAKIPAKEVRECMATWLGEVGRGIEMRARFAAYLTSREMGRSIDRSIWDAKEISVNFNKKGAGDRFMLAKGQTLAGRGAAFVSGIGRAGFLFWNAAIQGTFGNFGKAALRHPGKTAALVGTNFMLGMLVTALAASGGGDDDDSYYDLPEHVRRQNFIVKGPGRTWIKVPLPQEFRAVYGMGELAGCTLFNHEKLEAGKLAAQVTQLLPIDAMEGTSGLWPSSIKPAVDVAHNESWYGSPIWKKTEWNKHMPQWTKAYKNANPDLVNLAAVLNDISGGSKYRKGAVDLNPAAIEYLLKQYTGGYFTVTNQIRNLASVANGDKEFDWKYVPLVNRMLMTGGDERNAQRGLNEKFFRYMDRYDAKQSEISAIKNDGEITLAKKAELISEVAGDEDYKVLRRAEHQYSRLSEALKKSRANGLTEKVAELEKRQKDLKQRVVKEMEALEDGGRPSAESKRIKGKEDGE